MTAKKPSPPPTQDASNYTDAQHVTNLVLLVARLVQQVRNLTYKPTGTEATTPSENPVAAQAMDYLRRADLTPSITRGVYENIKRPTSPPLPKRKVTS
jgi:hypothetical protein